MNRKNRTVIFLMHLIFNISFHFSVIAVAQSVTIESTQNVPADISIEDYEKLKAMKQALDNERMSLESDIKSLNSDCSRVSSKDTAKIQECSQRQKQLLSRIGTYNDQLEAYKKQIALVNMLSSEQGMIYDNPFFKKYSSKEQEIQEAKKRLTELEKDIKKIQVHLKVLTKSLLANTSEFETWQKTVDAAVKDTFEKGKDYLINLPFEYGTYKLGEILKERLKEIEKASMRSADIIAGTTDPNKRERYRAARQWLAKEKRLAEYNLTQINNLEALKATFDLYAWDMSKSEDYEKIIEGLSWLAGLVSKPYSHIKINVEIYTNIITECYSWRKINFLYKQTDEYYQKVNDLSYRMNKNMEEIKCLKNCMNNYKEGCLNRCGGGNSLYTPPPLLD